VLSVLFSTLATADHYDAPPPINPLVAIDSGSIHYDGWLWTVRTYGRNLTPNPGQGSGYMDSFDVTDYPTFVNLSIDSSGPQQWSATPYDSYGDLGFSAINLNMSYILPGFGGTFPTAVSLSGTFDAQTFEEHLVLQEGFNPPSYMYDIRTFGGGTATVNAVLMDSFATTWASYHVTDADFEFQTPEPGSIALCVSGLVAMFVAALHRRNARP